MYRERIRERYGRLSKSQKRIADYLMVSPREAAFMTASHLASLLDVDIATVTRFAQRLSFRGYPELLADVRAVVRLEMSGAQPAIEGTNDVSRSFVRAVAGERENVDRTLSSVSLETIERAVAALHHAEHIYVAAQHLTDGIIGRLNLLGCRVCSARGQVGFLVPALINLTGKDVVLGIGHSEYALDVTAALRIARQRGATSIGITGSEVSPVARLADIVVVCSMASPLHLPAEASLMAVIEGLWQALAAQRHEQLAHNLRDMGRHIEDSTRGGNPSGGSIEETLLRVY